MPSILLDPHHQPSTTGFGGGKSFHGPSSRWRHQQPRSIIEQTVEDKDEDEPTPRVPSLPNESSGLDASVWETSPARSVHQAVDEEEIAGAGGGVLGLLYQFQKAQTDTRPGVNI
jgi:autophagy-related protein 9